MEGYQMKQTVFRTTVLALAILGIVGVLVACSTKPPEEPPQNISAPIPDVVPPVVTPPVVTPPVVTPPVVEPVVNETVTNETVVVNATVTNTTVNETELADKAEAAKFEHPFGWVPPRNSTNTTVVNTTK
jgi:hypothetical protein